MRIEEELLGKRWQQIFIKRNRMNLDCFDN